MLRLRRISLSLSREISSFLFFPGTFILILLFFLILRAYYGVTAVYLSLAHFIRNFFLFYVSLLHCNAFDLVIVLKIIDASVAQSFGFFFFFPFCFLYSEITRQKSGLSTVIA